MARQVTLGIDVGGTKVLGLAVDDEGVVLAEVRVATPRPPQPRSEPRRHCRLRDAVIDTLASVDRALLDGTVDAEVASVGVGAPGSSTTPGCCASRRTCPGATGSTSQAASRRASGAADRRRQRRHLRHGRRSGPSEPPRAPPTP